MFDFCFIGIMHGLIKEIDIHHHGVWEIVYYTNGSGILTLGDRRLQFEPGVIICQPPGVPHYEVSSAGFNNICLMVRNFINPNNDILYFKDNESKDFYNILMQVHKQFHIKPSNWDEVVKALVSVLYQYIIAWNTNKKYSPLIESFKEVLITNLTNRDFHIHNAMEHIPMSRDHFCRLFKKETGKTPIQYYNEKRISYASHLLETLYSKECSIRNIATLAGFDDPYYFSRMFKKVTGISPTEWCEKNVNTIYF